MVANQDQWDNELQAVIGQINKMMIVAQDVKKEFVYVKSTGKWVWLDRGEPFAPIEEPYEPFDSFIDCLEDAVGPYMAEYENPEDM